MIDAFFLGLRSARFWLLAVLLPIVAWAAPELPEGAVTMPLADWERTLAGLEDASRDPVSPQPIMHLQRQLEGTFRRGVFTGTLDMLFLVHEGDVPSSHTRVPVLDSSASIDHVELDGQPTSLLQEGEMYTVGVTKPGEHRVRLRFFQGREDDRFSRRLSFSLPPSGPTAVSIWVPEQEIEATLANGTLSSQQPESKGTRLTGNLDARGSLELTWKRSLTHKASKKTRTKVSQNTLFTLHEALVKGVTAFDFEVLEGETDRIELHLPTDIEVVQVNGDAVLQWYTTAASEGQVGADGGVTVLLRYLLEAGVRTEGSDRTRILVHFQFPVDLEQDVALRMPLPIEGVPMSGSVGVQGPAGLQVEVTDVQRAHALALRDLPVELTELTSSPLLLGFTFDEPPSLELHLTRQQEVELTSTLVDDIQASSVLMEDGIEVTKVRLRVRNNTRQHLRARLPDNATLTHCLVDGRPIRPAVVQDHSQPPKGMSSEFLLLPLRQSHRTSEGGVQMHTVISGETLSDIALRYYSDANKWPSLLQYNADRLNQPQDLAVGQSLRVVMSQEIEETSFVIELAYKRTEQDLGFAGHRDLRLPALDVDTMSVTWHLYLPEHLAPLHFDANLTQLSGIHYSPLLRIMGFVRVILLGDNAWAGGYSNILTKRKSIYLEENRRRQGGQ
ncbi:MAG: LysM peptidoglycan-binding domain-containing protein, partial [Proteobacteria bacterium]|nr:LysM peptidoglycan-binding domain-containing protein [Pseudomonadota bacterium]